MLTFGLVLASWRESWVGITIVSWLQDGEVDKPLRLLSLQCTVETLWSSNQSLNCDIEHDKNGNERTRKFKMFP